VSRIEFQKPTIFDVTRLMRHLRPHDQAELAALGGKSEMDLWSALQESIEAFAVYDGVDLVCLCGVNPHPHDTHQGVIWLLGTDLLDSRLKSLHKYAPAFIKEWHKKFPVLTNLTDQRNTVVLRWLQRLGFKLINTYEVGPYRRPFVHFIRESYV
jgi:hypothetical protein